MSEETSFAKTSVESATAKVKSISQDLRGKRFVVTGANTGIGYATARELAKMGATVTLACRNADKGKQAVDKLRAEALDKPVMETEAVGREDTVNSSAYDTLLSYHTQGVDLLEGLEDVDVKLELLDLASLQSVVDFVKRFKASGSKVDVLINNAGIMGIPDRRETTDGLELQMGVNHFGPHLLTRLIEPFIVDGGRVVFVSSRAHQRPLGHVKTTIDWDNLNFDKPNSYDGWMAYGRSKLANILDSNGFAKCMADRRVNSYAVHPGVVDTELKRHMTEESVEAFKSLMSNPASNITMDGPLTGALTTLRVAIDPSLAGAKFSGRYWGNMVEEEPLDLALDPAVPPRFWKHTEDVLEAKLGKTVDKVLD